MSAMLYGSFPIGWRGGEVVTFFTLQTQLGKMNVDDSLWNDNLKKIMCHVINIRSWTVKPWLCVVPIKKWLSWLVKLLLKLLLRSWTAWYEDVFVKQKHLEFNVMLPLELSLSINNWDKTFTEYFKKIKCWSRLMKL